MRLTTSHCLFLIGLCIHGATAAVIPRKPPAFAKPVYSDSYLPAVMQVLFHAADQLKRLEADEVEQNLLLAPSTSPHPPGQKQPLPTMEPIGTGDEIQTVTVTDEEKYYIPPERYQEEALIIVKPQVNDYEKIASSLLTPEVNHEESEVVYGLPETNYELPEPNHEIPEGTHTNLSQLAASSVADDIPDYGKSEESKIGTNPCNEFQTSSELVPNGATTSVVDSVVKEIYNIVKNSSLEAQNASSSSSQGEISTGNECIEGKTSPVHIPGEKLTEVNKERADELRDDQRFTLLGERVDQVPRPSLGAFLRAANGTTSPSLRQLGELYDALSKDARRQGLSKFAGYSDKVLATLQNSAGGGAGVQLKELLEKSMENMELTRFDAMEKTKETIAILKDDGSELSTKLRRLLPLRFMI